ncbi:MAG TPA: sigma-70 family RNA polymerase sigma factor, partial [Methylomirabilota bacterium]|nr:sigma-70 family RNA polymerase sigma factor [Methylomirabilota bacterium]
MEDWHLLQDYAAHHSETAFRALVERHLALVRSAALRQVNNPDLADEVSQAVFILLARKAAELGPKVILSGWLYRTTRFVAARALRSEQRRQRREQEAFTMRQLSTADDAWPCLGPLLDDAMSNLAEADRNALLLRFFQEQPLSQVGSRLGISEDAAKKRVARALDKLRGFFARHGFSVSAALVATVLGANCVQAVPVALSGQVVASAMAQGTVMATTLPLLVQQTLAAWRWTRIRLGAGLAAALLGLCLLPNAFSGGSQAPTQARKGATAPNSPTDTLTAGLAGIPSQPTPPKNDLAPHLAFRAVDAGTGEGVAHARVLLVTARDWANVKQRTDLFTDSEGRCDVPLGQSNLQMVVVGAMADGYAERCFFWAATLKDPLPTEYTLRLQTGARISGTVQDGSGNPVADAEILVQFFGTGDASWREFQKERPGFPADDFAVAQTDASGRWTFGSASRTNGEFTIEVRHPEFPKTAFVLDGDERSYTDPRRIKFQELLAGTAVLVLPGGLTVTGTVLDEQQNAIISAKVSAGRWVDSANPSATTGVDGSFTLGHLPGGQTFLTVTAKGFSPERIEVQLTKGTAPVKVELKPGSLLRIKVVNQNDEPVDHARVNLEQWRGEHNVLEWGGFTDRAGRIEWAAAPRDSMTFFAAKDGYFYSRNNPAAADGEEHVIRLEPQLTVSGMVIDAATRQPVPSFEAIPGSDTESRQWERLSAVYGTNGYYQLTFSESGAALKVRFEAAGYEPAISSPVSPGTEIVTLNMELKPVNLKDAISGMVYQPDGSPAHGAQVALCTLEKGVSLGKGRLLERS